MEALAGEVVSTHPALNVLINNAGVALFGQFREIELADMEWLININFWGVVYGTRFLLPHLTRQREAHIVHLSGIFGIIAPPGQRAYSAAKFAVRGFSEALRHELDMVRSPVRLSVVHPGGVATSIARNSRAGALVRDNRGQAEMIEGFERLVETTPQAAARRIIKGIERNEPRILIGATHAAPTSCNGCCQPPIGRSLGAVSKRRCDATSRMARDGKLEGLVTRRDLALGHEAPRRRGDRPKAIQAHDAQDAAPRAPCAWRYTDHGGRHRKGYAFRQS